MYTFLLTIAYDGHCYSGWQRQDGFDTIQERLEDAFAILIGEPVVVHGAGRTDAGVHAVAQSAHVRLPVDREPQALIAALNGNLPRDIAVRDVRRVTASFHARFSASGKRYVYRFCRSDVRPVFATRYCHWVRRPLDVVAMRQAARHMVGKRDFASLASNPGYPRKRGTVRTIQHLHLLRRPHGLDLVVQGDGFLYNMVRTLAGTLRDVGVGRTRADAVPAILAARDRRAAGPTLEPGGLFLGRVLYPPAALVLPPGANRGPSGSAGALCC